MQVVDVRLKVTEEIYSLAQAIVVLSENKNVTIERLLSVAVSPGCLPQIHEILSKALLKLNNGTVTEL